MGGIILEDYFKFIEECRPSFRKARDGKLEMFSCPTQHITGGSAKELLDEGVKAYKKYGNRSPLSKLMYDIEESLSKEPVREEPLSEIDLNKVAEYMKNYYLITTGNKIK
jgi:hypothetical protein